MAKRYEDRYGRGGHRRDRDRADDRGYMERAGDEVRSWFGDEDAERRRHLDEHRDRQHERHSGSDWDRFDTRRAQQRDWNRSDWRDRTDWNRANDRVDRGNMARADWNRSDWNRPDWSQANRGRADWDASGWEGSRQHWDRPEDWRHPDDDVRYRGAGREWSSSDWDRSRGMSGYDQVNRYRGTEAFGGGPISRGRSEWSVDEGRAQFGDDRWGRGPKGYQRSDARVLEDVCDRLTYSNVDAGEIEVRVENGEVHLGGFVRDRWDKRQAEDIAEEVSGVRDVHNNIRVRRDERDERGLGQSDKSASDQPGTVLGVNPTANSQITNPNPNAPPKRV
jgi:osmotically-inducible protein OsmY